MELEVEDGCEALLSAVPVIPSAIDVLVVGNPLQLAKSTPREELATALRTKLYRVSGCLPMHSSEAVLIQLLL